MKKGLFEEETMSNRKFLLGMLVFALIFGMTVVGCKEEDEPELPLLFLIEITGGDYKNPVAGDTLTATSTMSGYGTPTWQWYRGNTAIRGANNNVYTVDSGDIGYRLTVHAMFSGYKGFDYQETTEVVGTPQTASVSLSLDTYISSWDSYNVYNVYVTFTLSDGTWVNSLNGSDLSMLKSWVTINGTPNVSDWFCSSDNLGHVAYHGGGGYHTGGQTISFKLHSSTGPYPSPNLTVTFNSAKFAEMKDYTNIIDSLSANSFSITSSAWVQR